MSRFLWFTVYIAVSLCEKHSSTLRLQLAVKTLVIVYCRVACNRSTIMPRPSNYR